MAAVEFVWFRPFGFQEFVMLSPFLNSRSVPVRLFSSLLTGGLMAAGAVVFVVLG